MNYKAIVITTGVVLAFCISASVAGIIGSTIENNNRTYDIVYVLNGGTNADDNPSTHKSSSELALSDPKYEGYVFTGWYSDPELTQRKDTIEKGTTGTVTVYAGWEVSQLGKLLSFDISGSRADTSTSTNYGITGMMTYEYLDYNKKNGYQTKLQQYIYMDDGEGNVSGAASKNIRWSSENDDIEPVRGEDTVIDTAISGTITCEKWVFEETKGSNKNTETQYIYNDVPYLIEVVDMDGTKTTTIRYDLTGINDTTKTLTTRTFNWNCGVNHYSITLNVSISDFIDYRTKNVIRSQVINDKNAHDLSFVTYDDKYIKQIADYISSVSSGMTTLQKAQIILAFTQSIPYKTDKISMGPDEYWKYPLETLMDKNGDCEDTSFLFCSIAKAMELNCCLFLYNDHIIGEYLYKGHMSSGIWIYGTVAGKTPMIQSYYYCENTDNDHYYKVGDVPVGYDYEYKSRMMIVS